MKISPSPELSFISLSGVPGSTTTMLLGRSSWRSGGSPRRIGNVPSCPKKISPWPTGLWGAARRRAYTDVDEGALRFFTRGLEALGFTVGRDPVGTLVARNRPTGERVFGIGSHCDSNRSGGRYAGTPGGGTSA